MMNNIIKSYKIDYLIVDISYGSKKGITIGLAKDDGIRGGRNCIYGKSKPRDYLIMLGGTDTGNIDDILVNMRSFDRFLTNFRLKAQLFQEDINKVDEWYKSTHIGGVGTVFIVDFNPNPLKLDEGVYIIYSDKDGMYIAQLGG